jgi:hypothetical protein
MLGFYLVLNFPPVFFHLQEIMSVIWGRSRVAGVGDVNLFLSIYFLYLYSIQLFKGLSHEI